VKSLLAGTLVVAALAVPAAAAAAEDLALNWPTLLPGLTEGYDPSSENDCKAGRIKCVDAVIGEMDRRFGPLAETCDHDALFALLYLRVTETYREQVGAPGDFFADEAFVNHEDAVFARYYFEAQDAYAKGRPTPRAWQVAFDAASDRAVSGLGNLLLGVNAHVNRDLPYVLAAIGLVAPDGSSRKPDHDKVNEILFDAYGPAIDEGAARFDPSVGSEYPHPVFATLGYNSGMAAIQGWREAAWRYAERLVTAPDDAARARVEREIEDYAAGQAELIRAGTAYGPLESSGPRDAYCAANHG
jgi:hypothetical protein